MRIGPIDDTGRITPGTSMPPNYMGYVGLLYPASPAPLDIYAPGTFVTAMPALMQESAGGYNYQRSGTSLAVWRLVDANGNPIAPSIAQAAFGVPAVVDPNANPLTYAGNDLAPIDPARPFAALNGGWYYAEKAPAGAYATVADAFFNWGRGIDQKVVYSPRVPIPDLIASVGTGTLSGTLPGYSYGANFYQPFNYTLTYSAATTPPPRSVRPWT